MAIVIRHGKQWRYFYCTECGCEFKADESEYQLMEVKAWGNDILVASCNCPDCGHASPEDPHNMMPVQIVAKPLSED